MWVWNQAEGTLSRNGAVVSRGYSGRGRGKNNPTLQGVPGLGPIPVGRWRMVEVYNSPRVGPYSITLHCEDGTLDDLHDETGRSAFRIHGDSIRSPGDASRGCIILPRAVRHLMWSSGDHELTVQGA